jgi:C4-dicarboxylate-specific signal transduction histidine kinase
MGELAASIAHEANQPIAAIAADGEALVRWINRPDPDWNEARSSVQRMISEGQRAGEVIHKIRSVMRRVPERESTFDLNELIDDVVALIQPELVSHSVACRTVLAQNVSSITGDRIRLQHVLVSLLMNAVEDMPVHGEGPRVITVGTGRQSHDEPC